MVLLFIICRLDRVNIFLDMIIFKLNFFLFIVYMGFKLVNKKVLFNMDNFVFVIIINK